MSERERRAAARRRVLPRTARRACGTGAPRS